MKGWKILPLGWLLLAVLVGLGVLFANRRRRGPSGNQ